MKSSWNEEEDTFTETWNVEMNSHSHGGWTGERPGSGNTTPRSWASLQCEAEVASARHSTSSFLHTRTHTLGFTRASILLRLRLGICLNLPNPTRSYKHLGAAVSEDPLQALGDVFKCVFKHEAEESSAKRYDDLITRHVISSGSVWSFHITVFFFFFTILSTNEDVFSWEKLIHLQMLCWISKLLLPFFFFFLRNIYVCI